jgi:NitT/TauT family transport system permease protein
VKLKIRGLRFGVKGIIVGLASLGVFFLLWEALALAMNNPFLPTPYDVLLAFYRIATVGDVNHVPLWEHAATSLYRVLLGFIVGVVTAVPLGLLMGVKTTARNAATPIIEPIRFIPPMAWIPLTILLLKGLSGYVFLIWVGVFFPVLLNTIAGVRRSSITLMSVAKTFGADNFTVLRKVIFPSALPEIMTGLRVGMGIGWMCLVAAELIGGSYNGLGYLIELYYNLLQTDVVIVGMITIGIIGLVINYVMLSAEKRLFRWRVEVST